MPHWNIDGNDVEVVIREFSRAAERARRGEDAIEPAAVGQLLGGAGMVRCRPGEVPADSLGVLAVGGACLCWGLENNLIQRVSSYDQVSVVQIKALSAGTVSIFLALMLGQRLVGASILPAALGVGFVCYGISIVFDVYALRHLGAAREAAFFATAPFLGALAAVPLLGDRLSRTDAVGAGLMATQLATLFLRRLELPLVISDVAETALERARDPGPEAPGHCRGSVGQIADPPCRPPRLRPDTQKRCSGGHRSSRSPPRRKHLSRQLPGQRQRVAPAAIGNEDHVGATLEGEPGPVIDGEQEPARQGGQRGIRAQPVVDLLHDLVRTCR